MCKKRSESVLMKLYDVTHRYDINRPRSMHRHKMLNIKSITVWRCLYVVTSKQHLGNIWDWWLMKKSANTEAELRKRVAYIKACVGTNCVSETS